MEPNNDLNTKLKEEINKIFEDLFKKIGNNRQQLANKVIGFHKEINKELSKMQVDANREAVIRREVARIEKMAAKQLPHLERIPIRTPLPVAAPRQVVSKAPPSVAKAATPVATSTPAPVVAKATEPVKAKTPAPVAAKAATPAKAKSPTPAKTKTPAPDKEKGHPAAKAKKKKK